MERAVTVGLDGSTDSPPPRGGSSTTQNGGLPLRLPHAWFLLPPTQTDVPLEVDQNHLTRQIVQHAQAELQTRRHATGPGPRGPRCRRSHGLSRSRGAS